MVPCRLLEARFQEETAAKVVAINLASQMREQADDLRSRLEASVAAEDAAKRELSVYKQQVSAGNI